MPHSTKSESKIKKHQRIKNPKSQNHHETKKPIKRKQQTNKQTKNTSKQKTQTNKQPSIASTRNKRPQA
jgi:hypothetical protein